MTAPVRLRLSRAKGFDLQAASARANGLCAVKVDRTTKWGNPFCIRKAIDTSVTPAIEKWIVQRGSASTIFDTEQAAIEAAIKMFREWVTLPSQKALRERAGAELAGRNVACWCKGACHGDVWLELVNA